MTRARSSRARLAVVGVGVAVALLLAAGGVALAIAGAQQRDAAPPAPTASAEDVGVIDFCFVESMIYYRVESVDLSRTLLERDGVPADVAAHAESVVDATADELDRLREWYVSWTFARPLEWPDDGPCAGHADHSSMAGLPSWTQQQALVAASGDEAARLYVELMTAMDEAIVVFADEVVAAGPNARVADAAAAERERAAADVAALAALGAASDGQG